MSSVFIENYRGYDIMFSTSQEKFQSDIENGKEKNLLSSARKEIDDFIKANQNFNPIEVVNVSYLTIDINKFNSKSAFKVVKAIRKDKALQCDDNSQLSNYDIQTKYGGGSWFICNSEFKKEVLSELQILENQKSDLVDKIKEITLKSKVLAEKLKGEPVIQFRNRKLGDIDV